MVEIVIVLLQNGADINAISDHGPHGSTTALKVAIMGSVSPISGSWSYNYEMIFALLEHGADANAGISGVGSDWAPEPNATRGWTPLFFAVARLSNPEVIIAMLEAGADARIRAYDGRKAIDFARENPNLTNTEALRRLEAASR